MKSMMKYRISGLMAALALLCTSCIDMMEDVKDVEKVQPVEVSFQVNATTQFVPFDGTITPDPNFSTEGLEVTFTNSKTSQIYKGTTDAEGIVTMNVDPGVYNIAAYGIAEFNGSDYLINGALSSISLIKNITREEAKESKDRIVTRPAKVGSLMISEIYYCGSKHPDDGTWFRDQTYRIYNNGDEVEYLDGVCLAQINTQNPSVTVPTYPEEDGLGNFVYAILVWKIPGSGTEYPLQPGESVVLVQEAADHTVSNRASFDNSKATWECWSGNDSRDNGLVPNIPYIYWLSPNKSQWNCGVQGPAFVLFRAPKEVTLNEDYYRNGGPNVILQTNDKYGENFTARIPADWVLDAVEALANKDQLARKRIPSYMDAGATTTGSTYATTALCRKVASTRADGTPIYQDTNNSTNDFEPQTELMLRRHGEKAPAWSNWQ